jgi:hypothetical protein
LKVAALIAVMHQRPEVSQWDWDRSADAMAVSDATREWIVNEARRAEREKVRNRAIARAVGDEVYDGRLLDSVKRSIVRTLDRDGEQAGNELRSRQGKRDRRDMFDQAVAELAAEGIVESVAVDRGTRYRVAGGVQGEQLVQGQYPQVKEDDPGVQGELSNNVTDLDSRRPHEIELPKVSCQKWFDNHVAELRAAGRTTAKSFAVYEAGEAVGYRRGSLMQAASTHPDVTVIGKAGGVTTWSLTGQSEPYLTAGEWLLNYVDGLPADTDVLDPGPLQEAAKEAGYAWDTIRHALQKCPRIDSQPAVGNSKNNRVWHIVGTEETA